MGNLVPALHLQGRRGCGTRSLFCCLRWGRKPAAPSCWGCFCSPNSRNARRAATASSSALYTYVYMCTYIYNLNSGILRVGCKPFRLSREHVFTDCSTKIVLYFCRPQISLVAVGFRANTCGLWVYSWGQVWWGGFCGRSAWGLALRYAQCHTFQHTLFTCFQPLLWPLRLVETDGVHLFKVHLHVLPFIFITAVFGLPFVCSACKLQFLFFSRLFVTVLQA